MRLGTRLHSYLREHLLEAFGGDEFASLDANQSYRAVRHKAARSTAARVGCRDARTISGCDAVHSALHAVETRERARPAAPRSVRRIAASAKEFEGLHADPLEVEAYALGSLEVMRVPFV